MAGCVIEQEKASCKTVCFSFENVNCRVDLTNQIIIVKVAVAIFPGLEKNARFSVERTSK
jgi:hypothetical protein